MARPRAVSGPPGPTALRALPAAGRAERSAARTCAHSHAVAQLRGAFAFAPPLPLLPSLSRGEDRPGSRLPGALFCGRGSCSQIRTVSRSPPRLRHQSAVFQIVVFNCTCLGDYLREAVGGAERVENAALLCKRKKTLSPSRRPLPRVTSTSAGFGTDFAPDGSVGESGRRTPRSRDSQHLGGVPRVPCSTPSPRKPHAVPSRGKDSHKERVARDQPQRPDEAGRGPNPRGESPA